MKILQGLCYLLRIGYPLILDAKCVFVYYDYLFVNPKGVANTNFWKFLRKFMEVMYKIRQ